VRVLPPGGPPEGILDVAEYIVCRVVFFLLFSYFVPHQNFFFYLKTKIFRRENPSIKYGNEVPSLYAEVRAKALWFCSGGGGVFLFCY